MISGNQEPKSVELTQGAMDAGIEVLQGRLVEAMKDAHEKSVQVTINFILNVKLKMK